MREVAEHFKVSLTLMKRICREAGIQRWPQSPQSMSRQVCAYDDKNIQETSVSQEDITEAIANEQGKHQRCMCVLLLWLLLFLIVWMLLFSTLYASATPPSPVQEEATQADPCEPTSPIYYC